MRKDLILPRMVLVGVALLLIAIYLRDIGIIDWTFNEENNVLVVSQTEIDKIYKFKIKES